MASIADGIDFLAHFISGEGSKKLSSSGMRVAILFCYAAFGFFGLSVWALFSSGKFSALLTGAAFVQCLGFCVLCLNVRGTKSVAGISSKSLVMFVLHLSFRLTSTSLKNGYIPMDKTGDFMYQLFDFGSLLLVCHLLYLVHKSHAHTYQEEHDTLDIKPMVFMCVVCACFIHGTINKNKFFDIVWAISSNLETFVLVPQLWMMSRMGGKVDAMTAHYVASVVISGVMTFTFWWFTHPQLEKKAPNAVAKLIMVSHGVKLLLSADFMYYYAQAWFGGTSLVLPNRRDEMEM